MRGVYHLLPPQPRYTETWNAAEVVSRKNLVSLFAQTSAVSDSA